MESLILKLRPKYKELLFSALSIWLWFMRNYWVANKQRKKELEDELYRILKRTRWIGLQAMEFFLYVSNGAAEHKEYNHRTPFKYDMALKKFDLHTKNEKFFKILEVFLRVCKKANIIPEPTLEMGMGYNSLPYANNTNSIHGEFDPLAMKAHLLVATWTLETYRRVFSKQRFGCTIRNEQSHHDVGGWELAEYHRIIIDELLRLGVMLKNIYVDISHSEYCHANVIGRLYHHGRWWGNDKYLDVNGRRVVRTKDHGLSVTVIDEEGRKSISPTWYKLLGSAWKGEAVTEDGTACQEYSIRNDAGDLIEKVRCPSGYRVSDTFPYISNDLMETFETAFVMFDLAFSYGKWAVYGFFPLSTLKENPETGYILEYYTLENIEWDRMRMKPKPFYHFPAEYRVNIRTKNPL